MMLFITALTQTTSLTSTPSWNSPMPTTTLPPSSLSTKPPILILNNNSNINSSSSNNNRIITLSTTSTTLSSLSCNNPNKISCLHLLLLPLPLSQRLQQHYREREVTMTPPTSSYMIRSFVSCNMKHQCPHYLGALLIEFIIITIIIIVIRTIINHSLYHHYQHLRQSLIIFHLYHHMYILYIYIILRPGTTQRLVISLHESMSQHYFGVLCLSFPTFLYCLTF